MTPRFSEGDYVVTHDYRRGFVIDVDQKTTTTYYVVMFAPYGRKHHYSQANISLSGLDPTDEECVMFARYHLAGIT